MTKRILLVSLVIALTLTACATETTEDVVPTTQPTVVIAETTVATEPVVETEPVIEVTEATEVTEVTEVTEPVEVEEVTEPVEVTEPTEETTTVDNNYLGEFKLTAYCACVNCCGKSDGITATGTIATQGRTIAVDPTVIPYGSKVMINGHTYVAEDCGGAIKENRIDLFFDSHEDALNFGVQYYDVYLLGDD